MTRAIIRIVLAATFLLPGAVALAQATLTAVQTRGMLNCGVDGSRIGFSIKDAQSQWSGLDVDYCRAIAAAIFKDISKVAFVPLSSKERFAELQSGQIDVLLRDTTWTSLRDTSFGITFTGVNFYDYQAFMVRKMQVKSSADLNNLAICVLDDTTTELNLTECSRR
jgi:general L-amino acid transport system substrate-binding protein